jgi:hypothetical protein
MHLEHIFFRVNSTGASSKDDQILLMWLAWGVIVKGVQSNCPYLDFMVRSSAEYTARVKLQIFSKYVDIGTKIEIQDIFSVFDLVPNTINLAHTLIFNHQDRDKAYDFILNKFQAKLITVKAGRPTYINSILASIPIYYMSTILFAKTFMDKITAIILNSGGLASKKTNPPPLHLSLLGRYLSI